MGYPMWLALKALVYTLTWWILDWALFIRWRPVGANLREWQVAALALVLTLAVARLRRPPHWGWWFVQVPVLNLPILLVVPFFPGDRALHVLLWHAAVVFPASAVALALYHAGAFWLGRRG